MDCATETNNVSTNNGISNIKIVTMDVESRRTSDATNALLENLKQNQIDIARIQET